MQEGNIGVRCVLHCLATYTIKVCHVCINNTLDNDEYPIRIRTQVLIDCLCHVSPTCAGEAHQVSNRYFEIDPLLTGADKDVAVVFGRSINKHHKSFI